MHIPGVILAILIGGVCSTSTPGELPWRSSLLACLARCSMGEGCDLKWVLLVTWLVPPAANHRAIWLYKI
jgi:hypothetical protein